METIHHFKLYFIAVQPHRLDPPLDWRFLRDGNEPLLFQRQDAALGWQGPAGVRMASFPCPVLSMGLRMGWLGLWSCWASSPESTGVPICINPSHHFLCCGYRGRGGGRALPVDLPVCQFPRIWVSFVEFIKGYYFEGESFPRWSLAFIFHQCCIRFRWGLK